MWVLWPTQRSQVAKGSRETTDYFLLSVSTRYDGQRVSSFLTVLQIIASHCLLQVIALYHHQVFMTNSTQPKNIMLVLFESSYIIIFIPFLKLTLHKKWSFPLRISSVNLTKSAGNYGFRHIYRRNHKWKTSLLVQCQRKKWYICIFLHVTIY